MGVDVGKEGGADRWARTIVQAARHWWKHGAQSIDHVPHESSTPHITAMSEGPVSFLSLATKLHHDLLLPWIPHADRLAVSRTAKCMVVVYGGQFESLENLHSDREKGIVALKRLIVRQEKLVRLGADDPALAPALIRAMAEWENRTLQTLFFPYDLTCSKGMLTKKMEATVPPFLEAFRNKLPALEELRIPWACCKPVLPRFLAVLGQGGAPQLRRLKIEMAGCSPTAREMLGLLTEALQARAALGLPGLADLDIKPFNWMIDGPMEMRRQLWRVLLPTIETLSTHGQGAVDFDPEEMELIEGALAEHGAPCLRELLVADPRLAILSSHFTQVESMFLWPLSEKMVEGLRGAVQASPDLALFPPALKGLALHLDEGKGDVGDDFFAAVQLRPQAFPHLQELDISPTPLYITIEEAQKSHEVVMHSFGPVLKNHNVTLTHHLGAAFAAGAFGALESLSVDVWVTADGLDALVQGLTVSPCSQTLRHLSFGPQAFEGQGMEALGVAISEGKFPALSDLSVVENFLGDDWVERFVSSAHKIAPLETLDLRKTGVGDASIRAVVVALCSGKLGGKLEELMFGETVEDGRITDKAILNFARALRKIEEEEDKPSPVVNLETLGMEAPRVSRKAMAALLRAAVAKCPALEKVVLTYPDLRSDARKLMAIVEGTGVEIEFVRPDEWNEPGVHEFDIDEFGEEFEGMEIEEEEEENEDMEVEEWEDL